MLDKMMNIIATMNIVKILKSLRKLFLFFIEITNINGMKNPRAHKIVNVLANSSYIVNSI